MRSQLVPLLYFTSIASCLLLFACPDSIGAAPLVAPRSPVIEVAERVVFSSPSKQKTAAAKLAATAALDELERHLGDSNNGRAWSDFLGLDSLRTLVLSEAASESDEANREAVEEALEFSRRRLIGDHVGLEIPQIVALRSALRQLSIEERLLKNREANELKFKTAVDAIADAYRQPLDAYERYVAIEAPVAWLEFHGQADELVRIVKREYSHPNVIVDISKDTLKRMTLKDVYEVEPIDECEDGRHITGQAVATGQAFLQPVGGTQGNECQIVFSGTIRSTLRGKEGPVSFQLIGDTAVTAYRPVLMSDDRFQALSSLPVAATCLRTDQICTKRNGMGARMIRKIAARMIDKEQPEAQQDLNKKAVESFVEKFEEEIDEELLDAERDFQEDIANPIARMDLTSTPIGFHASTEGLQLALKLDGGYGVTAPSIPPTDSVAGDFRVAVHESTVNRLADHLLAGEEISNFPQMAKELGVELDEQALDSLPSDIGIEFAEEKPLTVEFANSVLAVTLRGQRYRIGRLVLVAMNATIRYRVQSKDGRLVLTMEGEPEITAPSGGRGARFIQQRRILKARLLKDLPKEEILEPFDLPSPADAIGKVKFALSNVDGGWLQLILNGNTHQSFQTFSVAQK